MLSAEPFLSKPTVTLLEGYFIGRDAVMQEILVDGWWPMAWIDKPDSSYPPHYHIGAEALYLLDGVLEFTETATNTVHSLRPGDKLILPARVIHSVRTDIGATYIISLSVLTPFDDHFVPAGEVR